MNKTSIQKKLDEQKNHLESLVQKAKANGIDQVEIFSSYGYAEEVSLEKNDLNNCTATEENMFGIRVIEKGNQGFITTNHLPSLYESILEARDLAKSQTTPDPDLVLPEAQPLEERPSQYDESLDKLGLSDLVEIAKSSLQWRKENFPKVNIDSGDMSLSKGFKLIVSSKGVNASQLGAGISASVMGMAVDGSDVGSFDYDSASGNDYPYFAEKWKTAFQTFGEKCMGALGAKSIPGFKGYILLPPDAVYSFFLGSFIGALNGTGIRKGKSKMAGKLGTKVADSKLSIWEDPTIDRYAGTTAFDREGQPTRKQSILKEGVLETYFYNTYEAKKAGLSRSNGFATGGAQALPGCGPRQLQIAPGTADKDDFFKLPEKTLFVNRISGTSDGPSGDFSGVVKGSYLLDQGEKIPVKEVQIVGNVYETLNRIVGISKQGELLGESYWAPYFLLEGFTITGMGDGN
ncbi:TldD/PmbA family protein [Leptospira idonii]|uniref:TldD/PmbA family protein n=1 Tax=Leptospira idonii TaxID=1193500 RepID=A0A4R9LY00_9LEPT|nr:TldD/PmbA family protein [Leptospira idonii]TGN18572.1 TldD/PmbA family protein [Leptospira idonii]